MNVKTAVTVSVLAAMSVLLAGCAGRRGDINAVVVTGGHGFKHEQFFAMFDSFEGVNCVEAKQADDSEIFEDISGWDRDVIVFYNMTQKIGEKRQQNFLELLDRGVGVVAMHHSIAAFQNWPEYRRIIGGRFRLKSNYPDDPSDYKHDVDIPVHIEQPRHPVTPNMADFVVNDEVYSRCDFEPDNTVLATTDHPDSDRPLVWVRKYRNARVCYIMGGHGPSAYADENFRRIVKNAISWCAKK
jgi:type 1 glutamine amidotransferase